MLEKISPTLICPDIEITKQDAYLDQMKMLDPEPFGSNLMACYCST